MNRSPNKFKEVAYHEARLLAGQVERGTTCRFTCPLCQGGRSGENSFAISKLANGDAIWFCHRANCGYSGVMGSHHPAGKGVPRSEARESSFTPKVLSRPTCPLESTRLSFLASKYALSKADTDRGGWLMDAEEGHFILPVWSPYGVRRGFELRRYVGPGDSDGRGPKVISYRERDENWMGWYSGPLPVRHGEGEQVVCVEDAVSALKVSRHYTSCFLIGTNINTDKMGEILEVAAGARIVLALDRDAVPRANDYAKRYRLLAPNLTILPLQKDLKYETDERIKELVDGT